MSEIGRRICELRKEKQMTQRALSEVLGVSTAAVSKWETKVAYPDIELLPKIASLFNISIDCLFEHRIGASKSVDDIIEQLNELFHKGKQQEAIEILSEAMVRYPNEIQLKYNRAKMMIYLGSEPPIDSKKRALLLSAKGDLLELIQITSNREIIDESYYLISMAHNNLSEFDEAIKAISSIHQSSHMDTNLALFRIYLDSGDLAKASWRFEFNLFLSLMRIHANMMWADKLFLEDDLKAIQFYEMTLGTFLSFSGDESSRFDVYISSFYERLAYLYGKTNQFEKVIGNLENACKYAKSYDQLNKVSDLPQFSHLNSEDTGWHQINNQKERLRRTIEKGLGHGYKQLLETDRFKNLLKSLTDNNDMN